MIPPIQLVDVTESTNDAVAALARTGAPDGTAVLARVQTGGRGRLGRSWDSPAGSAVLLSVLLRPALPLHRVPLVMLAAAVTVADACGPMFSIKWPNDVLGPDGRKVCGILAESEVAAGRLSHLIVGIGVNVTAAPPLPTASCVADYGVDADVIALAEAIRDDLVASVQALGEAGGELRLRARWIARSSTLGRRVRIGAIEGEAVGLADDGGLCVQRDDGSETIVHAGDVEMIGGLRA